MSLPTESEVRAYQEKRETEREREFYTNVPEGFEMAKTERAKWSKEPFTYRDWQSMTFGDQAYYARGGRRSPEDWMPEEEPLSKLAEALSLTPSPSIISGYRTWAFDLLDWLDRQGWKLVRK